MSPLHARPARSSDLAELVSRTDRPGGGPTTSRARAPGAHRAAQPAGPSWVAGRVLREALALAVPLECAGCGTWDTVLCDACARLLGGRPFRCEEHAPRLDVPEGALPVWAAARYEGAVRDAVVAWKDRGRSDVRRWLTAAVRAAAREAAPALAAAVRGEQVLLVPVPSRPHVRLRRGGDRTVDLAQACAAALRGAGLDAVVEPALAVGGLDVRDQVGLGARARGRNLRAGFRVTRVPWPLRRGRLVGRWCVVVDDVLTTGSTLAAAGRALAAAGARPLAGLVLAATPPPTRARDLGPLPRRVRPG